MTTLHTFDGYTLSLQALGRKDRNGHEMVRYIFSDPKGTMIFAGDDFGASPLHDAEGDKSAKSLLAFLTLRDGDTDAEYFANYTPAQIAFRDSFDCEQLQLYTLDD